MMKQYIIVAAVLPFLQTSSDIISIGEPLDINNVLRLEPQGDREFLPYGKLTLEVRGEARGLPVTDQIVDSNAVPCCRQWSHEGWKELDSFEAAFTNALLDVKSNASQLWALKNATGELISPPGPQNKGSRVCVTILLRLAENTTVSVFARLPNDTRSETRIAQIKWSKTNSWIVRRFERQGQRSFRNKQLQLVIRANQEDSNGSIMIQWASFCSGKDDIDTHTFPSNFTAENATSVFPDVLVTPSVRGSVPASVCMNGGRLDVDYFYCECPPGFTGKVCERGCGRNAFGVQCEGVCRKRNDDCHGVLICSRHSGCRCVAGLEGEKCDFPCKAGWYGSGCSMPCGECANREPCDPYTGRCPKGCEGSRQPPFCNYECGHITPSSALISYAEDASAEDFPWHTGVYLKQNEGNPTIQCGGTLVRPSYVISDAYTKVGRAEQFAVGFGKTYNEWDAPENHVDRVQFRDVSVVRVPENYRGFNRSYTNDIAVVKLARPVDITPYVIPICFDWVGGFELKLEDGDLGTIVGWGKTEIGVASHTLQKADLPFVTLEDCLDLVPLKFQKFVTDDKFCFGKRGGAVVNRGDSGGGLIIRQGSTWFLRGVVSVGLPEESPFTVYTNVSTFRDWIESTWDQLDIEDAVRKQQ